MQEWILWFISLLTLLGSILNVKKMPSSFVLWTISNIFWLVFDLVNKVYSRAALDVVNLATSIWGLVSWFKPSFQNAKQKSTDN